MNVIGREKWGPKAWHLLHTFSINNNLSINNKLKNNYYIFYTSFLYILPCLVCKEHYSDILFNILPLKEEKINRKYIEKWVFLAHNIVNIFLKKPLYTFKKCLEENTEPNNEEIMFFIKGVYLGMDYENMCIYNFNQVLNFFINFCILYPDKKIKIKLKKIIRTKEFQNIYSPNQLKKWFNQNENFWDIFIE